MENDSIRPSGSNTLVDIWVDGKLRDISVSREAIESYLGRNGKRPPAMSDEERCDFVRSNLSLVIAAARDRLDELSPAAATIDITGEQLWKRDGSGLSERRNTERRKGERRKSLRPPGPQGNRRRGERRKGERRKASPDKSEP